jgi:hypothetical protein
MVVVTHFRMPVIVVVIALTQKSLKLVCHSVTCHMLQYNIDVHVQALSSHIVTVLDNTPPTPPSPSPVSFEDLTCQSAAAAMAPDWLQ